MVVLPAEENRESETARTAVTLLEARVVKVKKSVDRLTVSILQQLQCDFRHPLSKRFEWLVLGSLNRFCSAAMSGNRNITRFAAQLGLLSH